MKHHVVFPAEEKNVALRRAKLAAKSLCELNGGEASANNDYSYRVHLLAPIGRLDTTENFGLFMGLLQLLRCRTGRFDAHFQDTEPGIARISGTCEPYSK